MGTHGVKHICRLSSAAGRYATESKEMKDTGRSANVVFWTSDGSRRRFAVVPSLAFLRSPWGGTAVHCAVALWRSFAESKWSSKHPWLVIQRDGVYCRYCLHAGSSVRSGSVVFVAEPFTGCWPDKLAKHEQGKTHQQNEKAYREWQTRKASRQTLPTIFYEASMQTVDEKAFMDG